jgi:hypothetical protein
VLIAVAPAPAIVKLLCTRLENKLEPMGDISKGVNPKDVASPVAD